MGTKDRSLIPIEDLDLDEPSRNAIELVRQGIPPVPASDATGADLVVVLKSAMACGLLDPTPRKIEGMHARISFKAGSRLEELLDDTNEKFTGNQLAVISGISTDKVAKFAGNGDQGHSAAAQLLAKLHAQGGGKITVTAEVADPADRAIDVTPKEVEP